LGCEENWAVYFQIPTTGKAADTKLTASRARYGVARAPLSATATAGSGQGWHTVSSSDDRFARWNVSADGANAAADFRNEPNTFGYNVEIDPLDPTSTPAKRVAMGRFAHEACVCSVPVAGKPLAFYMGCDSRNEYIYKFVTAQNWSASDIGGGMAAGDKYLNEGKLYVAKFNSDGSGEWIELDINNPLIKGYSAYSFANQADVYVNTRHAADAVGATKMDRPEWGALNPANGDVYFTLTNNNSTNRTPATVNAANPRSYADPDGNKGSGNPNGHIIRFAEDGAAANAMKFRWDIFLFGAEEDSVGNVNLSGLTAANSFSSPDGLWFSPSTGICWIQTDDGAFTDETNCMVLAAIPGQVGDGRNIVIDNELSGARGQQATFIGAALGEARLRRFLVAPKGSEVTGVTETADGKTLFVNIQHPGELTPALGTAADFTYQSVWPTNGGGITGGAYGAGKRPRSATLMITRTDGGKIGL
jgi:secreted PhoX family phosphatase